MSLSNGITAHVRHTWQKSGGPLTRAASLAYGLAADVRNAVYEAGLARSRRSSVPVISVGGLTAGGSGKTPLAAEIGRWLCEAGWRIGVVTHGYADELAVHRHLNPGALLAGGRDRFGAVRTVSAEGAQIVVVDSGFQHRRLERDLDVVTLDTGALTTPWRLPAGPFRERWSEVARADCVVVVDRVGGPHAGRTAEIEVLRRRVGSVPLARVNLVAGSPEPANRSATRTAPRDPVALAGVMWPDVFFAHVEERLARPLGRWPLPDHARFRRPRTRRIAAAAKGRGIVCTLKDAVKLVPALESVGAPDIPVWYVPEHLEWTGACIRLRTLILAAARHIVRGGVVGGPA